MYTVTIPLVLRLHPILLFMVTLLYMKWIQKVSGVKAMICKSFYLMHSNKCLQNEHFDHHEWHMIINFIMFSVFKKDISTEETIHYYYFHPSIFQNICQIGLWVYFILFLPNHFPYCGFIYLFLIFWYHIYIWKVGLQDFSL